MPGWCWPRTARDEVAGVLAYEISRHPAARAARRERAQPRQPADPATSHAGRDRRRPAGRQHLRRRRHPGRGAPVASACCSSGRSTTPCDNRSQADRIGIRTLANAGFDPEAMADFFETPAVGGRINQGDERSHARLPADPPDHLTRISEARTRRQMKKTPRRPPAAASPAIRAAGRVAPRPRARAAA